MKYIEIIQELQQKEPNKIIIVQCGAFFVALGKDAIMLNKLLKLKITCQKNNLCKVGVPVTAIMKYIDLLEKEDYSFSIYDYTKNNSRIAKVYNFVGKDNTEKRNCLDCTKCKSYNPWRSMKEDDIYKILAERSKGGKGTSTNTKI